MAQSTEKKRVATPKRRAKQQDPSTFDGIIAQIEQGVRRNQLTLEERSETAVRFVVKKGSLNPQEAALIAMESSEEAVFIPKNLLLSLVHVIQESREEQLRFVLEQEILQQMPIDFEDAMAVALAEIRAREEETIGIKDLKQIVRSVKKRHPNLFLQIDTLLGKNGQLWLGDGEKL